MPILRSGNKYRRYGSPQRMEFRRFGTPVKEGEQDRDPNDVFLSRRMLILRGAAAGTFAVIAGRLGYLQLGPRSGAGAVQPDEITRRQALKAPRGLITDRHGETLAENRKSWALALVRSKLPTTEDTKGNVVRDRERLDAMFAAVEQYVPLDWAMTITPLGPKVPPVEIVGIAERIERFTDFSKEQLFVMLGRENEDPILLAKNYTKEEINTRYEGGPPVRELLAGVQGIKFLRHAEWLSSRYSQLDPARPVVVKRSIPKEVALALDANPLEFPGMIIDETVLMRNYPAGDLTAHIVGYVGTVSEQEAARKDPRTNEPVYANDDVAGRMGVEAAMEDELRGQRGLRVYRVDAYEVDRGAVQEIPAQQGNKLELTLDLGLQKAMRDALLKQMAIAEVETRKTDASHSVHSAVGIALDPRNGEILAMVSLPSFDPKIFVEGRDAKAITALFKDTARKPTLNKAIAEVYPPGSVFKPFLAAAGLQDGVLKPNTTYICTNTIYIPSQYDTKIEEQRPCWPLQRGAAPHGPQAVVDALMNSCDIFFYNLGPSMAGDGWYYNQYTARGKSRVNFNGLGIATMNRYFEDFGFGKPSGMTDLLGGEAGIVPNPQTKKEATKRAAPPNGEPWTLGDTINVTIGQGDFLCSPLQMAMATAAIANGGNLHKPKLVRRVLGQDGAVLRTADPTPIRRVNIDPVHLDLVRLGMRRVITDGTAKDKFKGFPVEVAGKTGTAEYGQGIQATVQGRPLTYRHTHAWFTAFAPYKEPEIAVVIMVFGGGEGSAVAAPAANDVLQYYFNRKKP